MNMCENCADFSASLDDDVADVTIVDVDDCEMCNE